MNLTISDGKKKCLIKLIIFINTYKNGFNIIDNKFRINR
jgi:hypothetical protein